MSEPMENEIKNTSKIVDQAIAILGEHFDTVQVFVSRHDGGAKGGTITLNAGNGNWHARVGQVCEWVIQVEERQRMEVRSSMRGQQ